MEALARLRRSREVADRIPPALRALDLALIGVTSPLIVLLGLCLAAAVFLDSPGPVLYRSQRVGRGGRIFEMFKFRTMLRDAAGPPLSVSGDERFTPLGRRLALSRLDELPQVWNVIKGDMRLVGPRPEVEEFVAEYSNEYERILSVPPGLTGLAQLEYAWEGDVLARAQSIDRARVYRESILPYKLEIDLAYVNDHGVLSDVGVLLKTGLLPIHQILRRLAGAPPASVAILPRAVPAIGLVGLLLALIVLYAVEAAAPL